MFKNQEKKLCLKGKICSQLSKKKSNNNEYLTIYFNGFILNIFKEKKLPTNLK